MRLPSASKGITFFIQLSLILNLVIAGLILVSTSGSVAYAQDRPNTATVNTIEVDDDLWARTGPKTWYRNTADNVYDVTYEDEWSFVLVKGEISVEFDLHREVAIYADSERKPSRISIEAVEPPKPTSTPPVTIVQGTVVQGTVVQGIAAVVTPQIVEVLNVEGVPVETIDVTKEVNPNSNLIGPNDPNAVLVFIPPNYDPGSKFTPDLFRNHQPDTVSTAWTHVPGLYEGDTGGDLYKPFVETAFNSMKSSDMDVRGANNVNDFIAKLKIDKELRVEFMPFLLVAAYDGLISEQSNKAIDALRTEITFRSMEWQSWTATEIRNQWHNFKQGFLWNNPELAKPSSYQGNTLSALIDTKGGCNQFSPEIPTISIADDEAGVEALNQIFGAYVANSVVEAFSENQMDAQGLKWGETEIGKLETQLNLDLSDLSGVKSVELAFAKVGLGGATALTVVSAMQGVEIRLAFEKWKHTIEAKNAIQGRSLGEVTQLRDDMIRQSRLEDAETLLRKQLDDQIAAATSDAVKNQLRDSWDDLWKAEVRKINKELTEEAAESIAGTADNQIDEILEPLFKVFIKERIDEHIAKVGKQLTGEISEKASQAVAKKTGARLLKGFATVVGIVGIVMDAGEIIVNALPCSVWEKKVLADIQKPVKPDFRHALVTAGEYSAGLIYPHCKPGYKGFATSCVKEGCPFGYGENALLCTPKTIAKKTYGRGAGKHGDCGPDQVNEAGLCYDRCPAGYKGVGLACWSECPAGFTDTGALCTASDVVRALDTYTRIGKESSLVCPDGWNHTAGFCQQGARPGYDCNAFECWRSCPAGYNANLVENKCVKSGFVGFFSRRANLEGRHTRSVKPLLGVAGVGTCPAGTEQKAALCYPVCKAGYDSVGLNCSAPCPEGYHNSGLTCTADTIAKDTIDRNMNLPLACSSSEYPDKSGLLCYPQCREGFYGVGPVCWQSCPSHMTDTGALCTFTPEGRSLAGFAKEKYDRGVGKIPKLVNLDYEGQYGLDRLRTEFKHIGDTLKASTYSRVDKYGEAITADARREFRKEVFIHLARYFISEPMAQGKLVLPPVEVDF